MRTRIHITVDANTIYFLTRMQKEHNQKSLGQVVDLIVLQTKEYHDKDALAEMVAEKVIEKLKS